MKKLIRITTIPLSLDKLLGEQLRFMNQHFEVTAVSSDKTELKRVAEKYGVKHHHVEMSRQITPLKDLKSLWKMYRFLKKEKPEIVHTHTPKAGIIGMMAAYFAKVPVRMHTVAGLPLLEATGAKRKVLNFVEKLTYRYATGVYPNSFGLKEIILKEKFCPPAKLKVIGNGSSNGIDTEFFSPEKVSENEKAKLRADLGIVEGDFIFIFVGRLVKDKGIEELVNAFKNLSLQPLSFKLLLVGPLENELDPLSPKILKEIQENSEIILTGYQDDVRPYFALANALVFPSYREGFPNVVMQAGSMNLPSVVTDINGCNEIIEEGKNGWIVPVKNVEKLEVAMKKMMLNAQYNAMHNGFFRNYIIERYNQRQIWENILNEYLFNIKYG